MTPARARRVFARERARFAAHFPWVARARLVLLDRDCVAASKCARRSVAFTTVEDRTVSMLRRALALPDANVVALFRHELGHYSDVHVAERGRERRADRIAEWVTRELIRYDEHDVQTIARGRWPRPPWLPR